ncbi:MAG: hypothetical protein OER86_07915 [Phycisphaerae bacterium]|nr:hypothetical protein [Phycisphaerae bacterium]
MFLTLAARDIIIKMPEGYSSIPLRPLVYLLVALALALLAHLSQAWFRHLLRRTRPVRLFMRVSGELGLGPMQQYQIWRLARQQGLATPLTLLLSPGTFDHHLGRSLTGRPLFRGPRWRVRLEAIRRQLFGD